MGHFPFPRKEPGLCHGFRSLSDVGFGLASHLGVLCGIPCVGVGKKLFMVDGLEKGPHHKEKVRV